MQQEKVQAEKREERWPWKHHQAGQRDVTRSRRCTMSQRRLSGSPDEELCPAHPPHTLKGRSRPSMEDMLHGGLHRDLHAENPIQVKIILRRIQDPWKDVG